MLILGDGNKWGFLEQNGILSTWRNTRKWLGSFLCIYFVCVSSLFAKVELGIDNFLELHAEVFQGKKVGIIGNQTSLNSNGVHLVDLVRPKAKEVVLFGPEHGFSGTVSAGQTVSNQAKENLTVYSLYGEYWTPTPEMLKGVDVLVYDIQDVGVKFYTYISTLYLSLYAARRENIPIFVLDRPNPIGADRVEGPITQPIFCSFVGPLPLPLRYGMTIGELATLMNEESMAGYAPRANLTVVEMKNYTRDMAYEATGIEWKAPSPNLPTLEAARIYPGMCLVEGTNLSEGRGTDAPFLTVGAPYVNAQKWLKSLPKEVLAGVKAEVITFTPKSIPEKALRPKYENKLCHGLRFQIIDANRLRPLDLAVAMLCSAQQLFPKDFTLRKSIDRLWGNEDLRFMVQNKYMYSDILRSAGSDLDRFIQVRDKYLRYP